MSENVPFLAQMSCAPHEAAPLPALTVGADGLLRRTGSETPLIDEIDLTNGTFQSWLETFITRVLSEPNDPDMIRRGDCIGALITDIVRQPNVPDPDIIRMSPNDLLATHFTNGKTDQPDPDIFRR